MNVLLVCLLCEHETCNLGADTTPNICSSSLRMYNKGQSVSCPIN